MLCRIFECIGYCCFPNETAIVVQIYRSNGDCTSKKMPS